MGYIDDMRNEIRGEYAPVKKKKVKVRTVVRYVPVSYGYPAYPQYVPRPKRTVRRASGTNYASMLRAERAKDAYQEYKSRKMEKNIKRVSSGAKAVAGGAKIVGTAIGSVAQKAYSKAPRIGSIYGGLFKKKVSLPKATEKEVD